MEFQKKKCSLNEHKEIDSKIVCIECNIYMCNKCETFHSKLFPNHKTFNSDKDLDEIFTGFCKEEGHISNKLKFYCRTHNQLCCGICIAKIQKDEIGKHKDCSVCTLEEIMEEKKNKIEENIKYLIELSNTLEKSIEELKNIFENINKNKEEIKLKIQNVFTKLRNELNNREDFLLSEVDKKFNDEFCNENIVKNSEKLPEKIKQLLEKAESLKKDNNNNNVNYFINVCISVENNIKNIKEINDNIVKCKNTKDKKFQFIPDEQERIDNFIDNIKQFGEIDVYLKEIDNPWTIDRFKYKDIFYYTLKENNFLAEKTTDNDFIHLIKTKYQFKKEKTYNLKFIPNYKGGDFEIGFADFSKSTYKCMLSNSDNSVSLTQKGFYINKTKINENIKIENGKKYVFIIDMKKKKFNLIINEIKIGEYDFNFQDNVFAQAAIRNLGNSIKIKTYEI